MSRSPVAYFAATQTLKAGWFTLLCARLLGVKRVCEDSGCRATMYYWRGHYYLTDCTPAPGREDK